MASRIKTNYYVDGNTVRRLEGEPEERRQRALERERELRRRESLRAARKNQERALHMDLPHVLFCTMGIALTCLVCVMYINLQTEVTGHLKTIASLQSQVSDVRSDNDAALRRIEAAGDLNSVKNKAVNELGMGYATPEQIVVYSVHIDDYMDQYSDIPQ